MVVEDDGNPRVSELCQATLLDKRNASVFKLTRKEWEDYQLQNTTSGVELGSSVDKWFNDPVA